MKIRCPSCGNEGATEFGSDAFEVRGTWQGKPVRKCLRCGAGMTVGFPKRVRLIEPELWARMQESWNREFRDEEDDAELVEADDATGESEYPVARCPYCGNTGSTEPGSRAFEYRVALGEPKVRMCRRCERGFWLHSETGESEPMSEESWAGIEMMHATLGGGAHVDAEWARREAEGDANEAGGESGDDDPFDPGPEASKEDEFTLDTERAIGRAADALRLDDWPIQALDADLLLCNFQGENGRWRLYVQAEAETDRVAFYSVLDSSVPENRRSDVAELVTRANSGLWIGNFELDLSDGEVRFKTSIDVTESLESLTQEVVERLAYANVTTFDAYYPALMAVIHGGRTAEEALEQLSR